MILFLAAIGSNCKSIICWHENKCWIAVHKIRVIVANDVILGYKQHGCLKIV